MSYFTEMGALLNEAMNMGKQENRKKKSENLNESVMKKLDEKIEQKEEVKSQPKNYWVQAAMKLEESLMNEETMFDKAVDKLDNDPDWKDVKADPKKNPYRKPHNDSGETMMDKVERSFAEMNESKEPEDKKFNTLYDKVNYNVNKYLESEDGEEDKKELGESVITEETMWDKVKAHLNMVGKE